LFAQSAIFCFPVPWRVDDGPMSDLETPETGYFLEMLIEHRER
jgi:hypothetical protein